MVVRVPVIRVEMEMPGWNEGRSDLRGVWGAGYSIWNHLPVELNTLILGVFKQYKETKVVFESKASYNAGQATPAGKNNAQASKATPAGENNGPRPEQGVIDHNQIKIESLSKMMRALIKLQDYYKKKADIAGRWTENRFPVKMEAKAPEDPTYYGKWYAAFMHFFEEFSQNIWHQASGNKVKDIVKSTNRVFISLYNLQNYFLKVAGDFPRWTNPKEAPSIHIPDMPLDPQIDKFVPTRAAENSRSEGAAQTEPEASAQPEASDQSGGAGQPEPGAADPGAWGPAPAAAGGHGPSVPPAGAPPPHPATVPQDTWGWLPSGRHNAYQGTSSQYFAAGYPKNFPAVWSMAQPYQGVPYYAPPPQYFPRY